MKVNEIKSGYVLLLRNRELVGVYWGEHNEKVVSGEETWFPMDCLNDSLEYVGDGSFFTRKFPDYDVIAVYGRTHPKGACQLTIEDRELLWEREEVKAEDEDKCEECGCEECECEKDTPMDATEAAKATKELVDAMTENGFTKPEAMAFLASLLVGGMAMGIGDKQ